MCVSDPQELFSMITSMYSSLLRCYWSSSHLPKFRLSATYSEFSTSWSEWVSSPSWVDCLWLSGQPVFNQAVWTCQAWGESPSPPSAVFLPRPGKSEATAGQAPGTGLEKAESQPERAGSWWWSSAPLKAETEYLGPEFLLLTAVFTTVLGPLLQPPDPPPPHPRHLATPDLKAAASPGQPPLFSHRHISNHFFSTDWISTLYFLI